MGIDGLWKLVQHAGEHRSLNALALQHGLHGNRADKLYYIGVDVSIWMYQVQNTFSIGHAQAGENPELRTIFFRLSALAKHPIHLIFVADELVTAFGFRWLEAAGEAEAELCRMNQLGVIDAVMTEDSDALIHGAKVILRSPSFKNRGKDDLFMLRCHTLWRDGLSQGDMILLALLVGSDYDPIGLPRCGMRTALGVLKYGLGISLYAGYRTYDRGYELEDFFSRWRSRLRDVLRSDPRGFIGRLNPSLADSVSDSFPPRHVLDCFVYPHLLPEDSYVAIHPPGLLDIPRLAKLCEIHFSWGNPAQLLTTLRTSLWPAEVARLLLNMCLERTNTKPTDSEQIRHLLNIKVGGKISRAAVVDGHDFHRVMVYDGGFNALVTSSLLGLRRYPKRAKVSEDASLQKAGISLTVPFRADFLENAGMHSPLLQGKEKSSTD
ncbi:hypothetical protein ACG7TL_004963 [Trametes sanguinea]